jgi:hypothetical protein
MTLSAHVLRSAHQSGNARAAFKTLPQYRVLIRFHALRHGPPVGCAELSDCAGGNRLAPDANRSEMTFLRNVISL